MFRNLLLPKIGKERGCGDPAGRDNPCQKADDRTPHNGPSRSDPLGLCQKKVLQPHLLLDEVTLFRLLNAAEYLGQSEDAADDDDEIESSEQLRDTKANRGMPLTTSSPTVAMRSPISVERIVLMGSSAPKTVRSPKDMKARPKNSAGPKRRANLARAGAKTHQDRHGNRPRDPGTNNRYRQGCSGSSLKGHLITIDAGHDR